MLDFKAYIEDIYKSLQRFEVIKDSFARRIRALVQQFGELDNERRVHEERIDALERKATKQAAEIKDLKLHVAEMKNANARQGMH